MSSSYKTIAIVDDNFEDRRTYDRYLHQDTTNIYKILEAETGEEGLDLFGCKQPDLILLDFNLPDMDGLEFIAELKASCNCLPPIIMLTGEGTEAIAVETMKAGVKDYLIKGKTNADSLQFAVRNVLEQSRLEHLAQRNEHKFRVSVENMLDCFGIYTSIRDENARIVGFRPDYLNESACKNNLFHWQEDAELDACLLNILDSQGDLFTSCCEVVETGKVISTEYSSLLEYSRVGREKTPSEMFAVKVLLTDIIDSLAPSPTFAIAIDGAMPTLKTQKIALEQVFSNLISNAIKHHPSPEGKIAISATEDEKFYYFSVTDDGEGIAPEHQERIFGIFQTLSSRDNDENTGIGLSIVKKIVDSQGGKIELESQVGKGTTFCFSWRK